MYCMSVIKIGICIIYSRLCARYLNRQLQHNRAQRQTELSNVAIRINFMTSVIEHESLWCNSGIYSML